MAIILDIDHEGGNLTEYDSTTTDGGDLSVAAGAALAGTSYGMSLVLDDTNALRAQKAITKVNTYRERFYIDPNGLTMALNDNFSVHYILQDGGSYFTIARVDLLKAAGGYQIQMSVANDGGGYAWQRTCDISDAEHYIEFKMVRATNSTSVDGTCEWWVDGSLQTSGAAYDNFNIMGDQNWNGRWGAEYVDAGTSGTFYLDEIKANDDGSEIGPLSQPKSLLFSRSARLVPILVR